MAINVGDAVLKITGDTDDLDKTLKGLKGRVQKHMKAAGVGMTIAGTAIVGVLGLSTRAAANFEAAMRSVNSMIGLGQEEFQDFSDEVQALSGRLGVNAVDAANALYQAISAGIPKDNALAFLEIATKAGIAGLTSTEVAVDGLTTVLNAFKIPLSDTQKVADVMFQTVKGGKTTLEELAQSMFQVAPIAAAAGVDFEQVAAALATMTKQGVPTSVATTQLRQAIVQLQKPTDVMRDVITELGFASGEAMLQELGLAETLNVLRDVTKGSNEQLLEMFGSVEAGAAVLALTGENAMTFAADLDAVRGATEGAGAATDAYEEINKGASRQLAIMSSGLQEMQLTIGNVLIPVLVDLVEKVKPIITSILDWTKANPGMTKTIVTAVAILGGLLLVLGPLLIMLPGIIAAAPLVGAAFTLMLGPVGLVIAIIAGLIAAGVLLWKNWDTVKDMADLIWGGIVNVVKGYANILIGIVNTVISAYELMINAIGTALNAIPDVKIPSWVPGIGGNTFGIPEIPIITLPKIPTLAEGGIVTKPTLALIGENGPEAVVPLGKGMGATFVWNQYGPIWSDQDMEDKVGAFVKHIADRGGLSGVFN